MCIKSHCTLTNIYIYIVPNHFASENTIMVMQASSEMQIYGSWVLCKHSSVQLSKPSPFMWGPVTSLNLTL